MKENPIENGVVVRYEGPATVGGSGRARLHERASGVDEMLWEALDRAGWVGEMTSSRMTVALTVGVGPPRSGARQLTRSASLPGGVRRIGDRGWIDDRGTFWQQSVGPISGRAAGPGYRLTRSELLRDGIEFGENMIYTSAVLAGWRTNRTP